MADATQKINEFPVIDDFTADDQGYVLRNGTQDKTANLKNATEARAVAVSEPLLSPVGGINGLKLAYASTTTFSVATGAIPDSTLSSVLKLSSSITKSLSLWAVGTGNGGLDAGTVANSTWYAVFIIKRVDTGVVDVLISLSDTAPTLPSGYTLSRRIGWILTNGSAQITDFFQIGRQFFFKSKSVNLNAATPGGTTRQLVTVTAPKGSEVVISTNLTNTVNGVYMDLGATPITDTPASATNFTHRVEANGIRCLMVMRVQVDASRQIYYRVDVTSSTTVSILTQGWIDDLSA